MNLRDLARYVAPLRNRLDNLVSRGVLKLIDDAKKFQQLQVLTVEDEVLDDVERFQTYGYTAHPRKGAVVVVLKVGGRGDHPVVIACDDRRYRIQGLQEGEVCIYTDQGDRVIFKRGGTIDFQCTTKVQLSTPLVECSADLKVGGKLDVTGNTKLSGTAHVVGAVTMDGDAGVGGTLTAATEVVGGGKSLSTHTHGYIDFKGQPPVSTPSETDPPT